MGKDEAWGTGKAQKRSFAVAPGHSIKSEFALDPATALSLLQSSGFTFAHDS